MLIGDFPAQRANLLGHLTNSRDLKILVLVRKVHGKQ